MVTSASTPAPPEPFAPVACVNCGSESAAHETLIQTQVVHRGHLQGRPLRVALCPRCGLTFLNPQPTPAALGRFYEHEYYTADKPVDPAKRLQEMDWQRTLLLPWLLAQLPPVRGWTVLDIGCGYGEWLRHFDRSNRRLGIEQSQVAAQVANERFGVEVRQCDFMANDCQPESFDLVTGLAIIEHFNDPLAALVEMNRLAKPGGHLYLQTPDVHALAVRKGIERYFKLVHTYYYTPGTLTSLLHKAGVEVLAVRRRPAVLSASTFLRPGQFCVGEQDVVARKTRSVSLAEARQAPPLREDPQLTRTAVADALRRDLPYVRLNSF
ncbi:MAG: class I SAM-dependent methyltransferase [Limisphaerales bacterium]